ncbi:Inner membrane protein yiaV precursor [Cedecea davisae]|uniref:Auxiliary transport protein, membrane fusion protein family protein n=1 Tax=Cedecea davisae DSM 4568 TaxID=566551 RepID=S3JV38_9ENTR|nr:HlyD family secretion protein [Cedecea davisae]EPF17009.1 auxiliary transport protein, membrane fusion protein family protein [Cedecea davisae DSM 4568]STA45179.1 Inner membrane protein yiaV precursor [Cedecea davisae]
MTPEQRFTRWVKVTLALFAAMFFYFLAADIWVPQTPDSTVMRVVTPISSRVSGYVTHIYVSNNSLVKKGDVLFEIDNKPYQNQLERAEIGYRQAILDNQQIDAQIAASRAKIKAAQLDADNAGRSYHRYNGLSSGNLISRQDLDTAFTRWQSAEQNVNNLKAALDQLVISRGSRDEQNVTLQKYRNLLNDARLNLDYTRVVASSDGVISNLQLKEGWYAGAGAPALALVSDNLDIVADFREKSLSKTLPNTAADIVFDGLPGQVFKAHVSSKDAGVLPGQQAINGQLSAPETSNRWVRDAQRMRIHLTLEGEAMPALPAGARATVQLYNSPSAFASFIGSMQIKLVSWLHYVY